MAKDVRKFYSKTIVASQKPPLVHHIRGRGKHVNDRTGVSVGPVELSTCVVLLQRIPFIEDIKLYSPCYIRNPFTEHTNTMELGKIQHKSRYGRNVTSFTKEAIKTVSKKSTKVRKIEVNNSERKKELEKVQGIDEIELKGIVEKKNTRSGRKNILTPVASTKTDKLKKVSKETKKQNKAEIELSVETRSKGRKKILYTNKEKNLKKVIGTSESIDNESNNANSEVKSQGYNKINNLADIENYKEKTKIIDQDQMGRLKKIQLNSEKETISKKIASKCKERNINNQNNEVVNSKNIVLDLKQMNTLETKPILKLNMRKRRLPRKNYIEKSLCDSPKTTLTLTDLVEPIYRRPIKVLQDNKVGDIFEFCCKEEIHKKKSDSDNDYDVDIRSEMKKIEKLEKRGQVRRRKCLKENMLTDVIKSKVNKVTFKEKVELNAQIKENGLKVPLRNNSSSIENDDCFGFESERQINIISDVQIRELTRPNANSTMITSSPWRSNLITPRALFLKTKSSNLPSFNQELPINSTILENCVLNCSKTNETIHENRMKKQSSILSYVNSGFNNPSDQRSMNCSLFDIDQLSPIKSHSETLNKSSPLGVRRNILTERNVQDVVATATSYEADLENSYFGFNSTMKENTVPSDKPMPSRFSPKVIKMAKKSVEKLLKVHTPVADTPPTPVTQEGPVVGLFDDLLDDEIKMKPPPRYSYRSKRTKRPRYISYNDESDVEDEQDSYKKKRKHVRTVAEEMEAHRWATAFNAMCEEVDSFVLNVE